MDGNQPLGERTARYSLNHLMDDCDLVSAMNARHTGASVNSTKTGLDTIRHILIANRTETAINKCGQLPFDLGFDTNHRAMFANLQVSELLQLRMDEPAERSSRRL